MTALHSPTAQAHADASDTEKAAQRRAARFAGTLRGRLLQLIADAGEAGLTATEAFDIYVDIYGEPRGGLYSLAPRASELERAGYVTKGWVRDSRAAYVITAEGGRALRGAA